MLMMTMRRLTALYHRAFSMSADASDLRQFGAALAQRRRERGRSKLARRLSRKAALGRAGAF